MTETRNLCAQLPLELHQRVCEVREQSGQTTAQYITNVLLEYYEMKENGGPQATRCSYRSNFAATCSEVP